MHTRGGRHTAGDDEEEEPRRFLIDVEMSRLGRIQLDGLIRAKDMRFDLVMRSVAPLPNEMRQEINRIFATFMEISGVAGTLQFQAPGNFVEVSLPDASHERDKGITI